jgi:Rrf2 family nitric oxide-sensitive transcriptional repressor
MRLTRFTDYSLRVLIFLGQNGNNRVTIHQISEAYGISKNHLMKVVSNLTRLQIVVAQRGPGGGIRLNRLPEEISLKEVIGNTEKHLQQIDENDLPGTNEKTADTRLNDYLQHALQAYLETLGHFTLADVLEPEIIRVPELIKNNCLTEVALDL